MQYVYTEEEKANFRRDPDALKKYRKKIQAGSNRAFDMFVKNSEAQEQGRTATADQMRQKLNNNDELAERLIPDYEVGTRQVFKIALTNPRIRLDAAEQHLDRAISKPSCSLMSLSSLIPFPILPLLEFKLKTGRIMNSMPSSALQDLMSPIVLHFLSSVATSSRCPRSGKRNPHLTSLSVSPGFPTSLHSLVQTLRWDTAHSWQV